MYGGGDANGGKVDIGKTVGMREEVGMGENVVMKGKVRLGG